MEETSTNSKQSPAQKTEKGIDVSHWQGNIEWNEVAKSGVKYVCIKMTESGTYVDPNFTKNWEEAENARMRVNCYHYFRGGSTPGEQMANIKKNLAAVKFDPAKNALAIYVEEKNNEKETPEQMAKNLNSLLILLKKDKILPMIYTSYGCWDKKVKWGQYSFGNYSLWVAHYIIKLQPILPMPWRAWWQFSAKGKVDGIKGDVDMNLVRV